MPWCWTATVATALLSFPPARHGEPRLTGRGLWGLTTTKEWCFGAIVTARRKATATRPISVTLLPAHLSFVNAAERSRALHTSLKRDLSHGSEPGKPHSRARLRDLDLAWLRTRSGRSALACGRARNLDGIDGHAPRQTGPEKEATVACTFEDRQNARGRRLTPQSTARLHRPRTLLYGGREWEHCEGGAAAPALPGAALCSRLCRAFSRG